LSSPTSIVLLEDRVYVIFKRLKSAYKISGPILSVGLYTLVYMHCFCWTSSRIFVDRNWLCIAAKIVQI